MTKLWMLFSVLRMGRAVADPALWKSRSGLVVGLSALIVALAQVAKVFGFDAGIDNDVATAIAGGIAAIVGLWSNYATSEKVGLGAPPEPEPNLYDAS